MTARLAATPTDPDEARRRAEHILSDRRFRADPAPRPLRGVLRWLGARLDSLLGWIGDRFAPVGRALSHVPRALVLAAALAIAAAVIVSIVRIAARRRVSAPGAAAAGFVDATSAEDARALERDAELAERAGDLDGAVRLRFRAGLVRLGVRGAIDYRPSVTTSEVRRVLGSETFDELAATFEAIAYGGRAAQPPDVEAARKEWPRLVREVPRRA